MTASIRIKDRGRQNHRLVVDDGELTRVPQPLESSKQVNSYRTKESDVPKNYIHRILDRGNCPFGHFVMTALECERGAYHRVHDHDNVMIRFRSLAESNRTPRPLAYRVTNQGNEPLADHYGNVPNERPAPCSPIEAWLYTDQTSIQINGTNMAYCMQRCIRKRHAAAKSRADSALEQHRACAAIPTCYFSSSANRSSDRQAGGVPNNRTMETVVWTKWAILLNDLITLDRCRLQY
jgi:hypothetical protein